MSDYVHSGRRSRSFTESKTIESRVMFVACFVLFLARGVFVRMMPWKQQELLRRTNKESIFSEARTAAATCVTSSFTGL